MEEVDYSHNALTACYRCHSQKLRCARDARQTSCKRCIRAQIVCVVRPSRRTQKAKWGSSSQTVPELLPGSPLPALRFQASADFNMNRHEDQMASPDLNTSLMVDARRASNIAWTPYCPGSAQTSEAASDSCSTSLGASHIHDPTLSLFRDMMADKGCYDYLATACQTLPTPSTCDTVDSLLASGFYTNEAPQTPVDKSCQESNSKEYPGSTTMCDSFDSMEHTHGLEETSEQPSAESLDCRLVALNAMLHNHQTVIFDCLHAFRAGIPFPASATHETTNCLPVNETIRLALQLLSILRESLIIRHSSVDTNLSGDPAHSKTGLLFSNGLSSSFIFLSSYTCLAAIFNRILGCLQTVLEQDGSELHSGFGQTENYGCLSLSRLLPPLKFGSLSLGPTASRLQALFVTDAFQMLLHDLSETIPHTLEDELNREGNSNMNGFGAMQDMVGAVSRVISSEQTAVSNLTYQIRRILMKRPD
jgi:hypothetical protein